MSARQLLLVRHGPTHAKAMVGWTDLPADLSDHSALARLEGWLPKNAACVASDLRRASDTASAIAGNRQRLPDDPDLREMNFGAWEMKTWKEVAAKEPERIRAFYETPGSVAPPGGESWDVFRARTSAAVDRWLDATKGDLIIVCHFGVILSQLQRATGKSAYECFAQKVDNLSVTQIFPAAGQWSAGVVNHCP